MLYDKCRPFCSRLNVLNNHNYRLAYLTTQCIGEMFTSSLPHALRLPITFHFYQRLVQFGLKMSFPSLYNSSRQSRNFGITVLGETVDGVAYGRRINTLRPDY